MYFKFLKKIALTPLLIIIMSNNSIAQNDSLQLKTNQELSIKEKVPQLNTKKNQRAKTKKKQKKSDKKQMHKQNIFIAAMILFISVSTYLLYNVRSN